MFKERGIIKPEHLKRVKSVDLVEEQMMLAVQKSELGMIHEITKDVFPDLASEQPDFFNRIKIYAIGNRVEELMGASSLVQVNPEARGKIKAEVSRLMNDASEIVNSWLENGKSDENIQVPFLFGRNEAQSFDAAINLGLVNLINEVNFPFLAVIHKDDILRFKLMSINTALVHWQKIEAKSEGDLGFPVSSGEISNLNIFANKKVEELQEMKEELLIGKESSE